MRCTATCLGFLLLAGCGARTPDQLPIDPALSTLVPPDTVVLAGVRVDDLQQAPGFDALLGAIAPAALWQFIQDTGLDPAEDLWELLFASDGGEGVLMIRGRFSESGLEPRFDREGARRMPYRGYMMIGNEQAAVLFVNATTALLGSTHLLESIVDGRDSYQGVPDELTERIDGIDSASQIWAVSTGRWQQAQSGIGAWSNIFGVLSRVEGLTMSGTANGLLSLLIQADCSSDEEAESLLGNAKALLALARFTAADSPAAAALLSNVGLLRTEARVELVADLSSELLVEMMEEASVPELR